MNIENPRKYSLQLATFNVVKKYAKENCISIRQSSFIIFSNLKRKRFCSKDCGFNLQSKEQFYSSLKRFKSNKIGLSQVRSP